MNNAEMINQIAQDKKIVSKINDYLDDLSQICIKRSISIDNSPITNNNIESQLLENNREIMKMCSIIYAKRKALEECILDD